MSKSVKGRGSIPVRQCVGCRLRRPKKELIRLVYDSKKKAWVADPKNKISGRAIYICPNQTCLDLAKKKLKGKILASTPKLW